MQRFIENWEILLVLTVLAIIMAVLVDVLVERYRARRLRLARAEVEAECRRITSAVRRKQFEAWADNRIAVAQDRVEASSANFKVINGGRI